MTQTIRSQEEKRESLKRRFRDLERMIKTQGRLELNFYIQKKMMDFPETYMEEIKKDIAFFEEEME